MAIIQSGATTDLMTVDPTSKAGRVTLYHSNGSEVDKEPITEVLVTSGTILTTAALANGAGILAIRNGSVNNLKLDAIEICMGFTGTAAASVFSINMYRHTSASTTASGGTVLVPALEQSNMTATTIADSRVCAAGTALTITGLTSNGFLGSWSLSRSVTGGSLFLSLADRDFHCLPSEGYYFTLGSAGVIGDSFSINCYLKES